MWTKLRLIMLIILYALLIFCDICSRKSLMYIKNNTGPRMLPCGIPLSTLYHPEYELFNPTRCFLLHRKSLIHCSVILLTPYDCNFLMMCYVCCNDSNRKLRPFHEDNCSCFIYTSPFFVNYALYTVGMASLSWSEVFNLLKFTFHRRSKSI